MRKMELKIVKPHYLAYINFTGEIRTHDLQEVYDTYVLLKENSTIRNYIVDFRKARFICNPDDLLVLSEKFKPLIGEDLKKAFFLANTPKETGLLYMFIYKLEENAKYFEITENIEYVAVKLGIDEEEMIDIIM